jgi:hypothetical protein
MKEETFDDSLTFKYLFFSIHIYGKHPVMKKYSVTNMMQNQCLRSLPVSYQSLNKLIGGVTTCKAWEVFSFH